MGNFEGGGWGDKKCIILKNHFRPFVVHKTLHVVNENLPVTIVDNQSICRNFHQACYDKIEVDATTEFSRTQCKTKIDYTIHVPKKICNLIFDSPRKKAKQNKTKRKRKEKTLCRC